ncbi:hypothetical protein IR114_06780 [Granulicatella sp. 19428wC4_WM01]|nr:hypothetical protein [Granulicatella sp. 19428wC4_WM01]
MTQLEITTNDSWANTHGTFRDHPSYNWEQGRLYRSWARAGMAEVWNYLVEDIKLERRLCKGLERAYMSQKVVQELWKKVENLNNE